MSSEYRHAIIFIFKQTIWLYDNTKDSTLFEIYYPNTIKAWKNEKGKWILRVQIADYEKENPNVKIRMDSLAFSDVWARLVMDLAAGKAAEVVLLPYLQQAATLACQGYLYPINEVMEAVNAKYKMTEEDYAPYSLLKIDNNHYVFPYDVNSMMLFINMKQWEEAGLTEKDVPKSWDELIELKKTLEKPGERWTFMWTAGRNVWSCEHYLALLMQAGGRFFNDDFDVILDTECLDSAVLALEYYKKLHGISPPGNEGFSATEMLKYMSAGRVTVGRYTGGRMLKSFLTSNPDLLPYVRSYRIPQIDPKKGYMTYAPIDVYAVIKPSVFPKEGAQFLKWFLTSHHFINFLHTVPTHFTPPIKGIWESEDYRTYTEPGLEKLVSLLKERYNETDKLNFENAWYGYDFSCERGNKYYNPFSGAIWGGMMIPDMVQNYILGKMDAREAIKLCANQIRGTVNELKKTMQVKVKIEAWKAH